MTTLTPQQIATRKISLDDWYNADVEKRHQWLAADKELDLGDGFSVRQSTFARNAVSVFYGRTCIASSCHSHYVAKAIRNFGDRMSAS